MAEVALGEGGAPGKGAGGTQSKCQRCEVKFSVPTGHGMGKYGYGFALEAGTDTHIAATCDRRTGVAAQVACMSDGQIEERPDTRFYADTQEGFSTAKCAFCKIVGFEPTGGAGATGHTTQQHAETVIGGSH